MTSVTIEKAQILIMIGCERNAMEEQAKNNITVNLTSNTNIFPDSLQEFIRLCHSGKRTIKLTITEGESVN